MLVSVRASVQVQRSSGATHLSQTGAGTPLSAASAGALQWTRWWPRSLSQMRGPATRCGRAGMTLHLLLSWTQRMTLGQLMVMIGAAQALALSK